MLDDDAQYQCQVGTGPNGETAVRSRAAHLSVLTPPEPPRIVQGDFLLTTEDREIELECVSASGKPAAEVRVIRRWVTYVGKTYVGSGLKLMSKL